MYEKYNANPKHNRVGDCVVRAISKLLNQSWEKTYAQLAVQGLIMSDMPSSNAVWGEYLKSKGFARDAIPAEHSGDLTVRDFCESRPKGKYLLAISGHVVAVEDGIYYDTWDSGDEVPAYYWHERRNFE